MLASDFWILIVVIVLAFWWFGLDGMLRGGRRGRYGRQTEVVAEVIKTAQAKRPLSETQALLNKLETELDESENNLHVGHLVDGKGEFGLPMAKLFGRHWWTTGATGSGKSAHVLYEELELIKPFAPWQLVHLDAKGESASWLTELALPAMLALHVDENEDAVIEFLKGLTVVNPFDEKNLPKLNVLTPLPGVTAALQAREVANLIGKLLGPSGGNWGPRMTNILFFSLRLALDVGEFSFLEVRSLLVNDQYRNAILGKVKDPEVREYFAFRFPGESKEAIQAVASRLDLLLLEDTARVLCADNCLSPAAFIELPLSVINVGNAPHGAEFLSTWWMGVFVRGLARAIMSRRDTKSPTICVVDEWWLGLDEDLAFHFERLLTQARFKNVALWLVNQLPAQLDERLLRVIENSVAFQSTFRQSHRDAKLAEHIFPVSDSVRVRKSPDGPAWDTRTATPAEQRAKFRDELSELKDRHFWFYPKIYGAKAVKLKSPNVDFDGMRRLADSAPDWVREACRGRQDGMSREDADEVIAMRRARMAEIARGSVGDEKRRRPSRPKDDAEEARQNNRTRDDDDPPPAPVAAPEPEPDGPGGPPEATANGGDNTAPPPPGPRKRSSKLNGKGKPERYIGD